MLTKQDLTDVSKLLKNEFKIQLQPIYDKLIEHDKRFESIDKQFKQIDSNFDNITKKFGSIDRKFIGLEYDFENIDKQFNKLNKKINKQHTKNSKDHTTIIEYFEIDISHNKKRLDRVESHLGLPALPFS